MFNFSLSWGFLSARYGKYFNIKPFLYHYTSPALAANAQNINSVTCVGNAYTLLMAVSTMPGVAPAAGVVAQSGDFTLQISVENEAIQDGAIINFLYGAPVYYNALANSTSSCVHATLTYPIGIKQGGYLRFTIVNAGLANNIVRLVFHTALLYLAPGMAIEKVPADILREIKAAA